VEQKIYANLFSSSTTTAAAAETDNDEECVLMKGHSPKLNHE
jgi:hypothetical protein